MDVGGVEPHGLQKSTNHNLCIDPWEANIGIEAPLFKDKGLSGEDVKAFFTDGSQPREGAFLGKFVEQRGQFPSHLRLKICGIGGRKSKAPESLRSYK